jgi:serine/threonine protein kinase
MKPLVSQRSFSGRSPEMSAPHTSEGFLDLLANSKLLAEPVLSDFRKKAAGAEPRILARQLVADGRISLWQAKQLLAGGVNFYLGRYKLIERLGEGARGKVYRAEQSPSGRTVVLKVLSKDLLKDHEVVARWQREVRLAAALNHASIITAYDAENFGDVHFMVMEFVAGRDLKHWSDEQGRLPIDWSSECIRQAAEGLGHAHERGVIHRDIKASNMLVVAPDTKTWPVLKILDLGFARFVAEETDSLRITHSGQTFGTPDYMAPEQAESARNADPRSDIFSLGCTFFKLLTTEFPYTGVNSMQKLIARAMHDARPVREVRPDVPEGLAAVLARMLARKPEDRYQTCREVAAALVPFAMPAPQ